MIHKRLPIVAIVGRSNVGKSSLFNAMIGKREVIVAREAGTTRDSITSTVNFNNQQFWLVDTAGIKDPVDDFEASIQEQIIQASESADIILVVVEAHVGIVEEDRTVAKLALKSHKPVILVVNKIDKASQTNIYEFMKLGIKTIETTSVAQSNGIYDLLSTITQYIERIPSTKDVPRIRVSLLGRPNVGKSSLFNSLIEKQQAIVSQNSGTTRDVNRKIVRFKSKDIELMDTAGIRRPGRIEKGVEQFSVMRSLSAIEESDICLLLIDSNEPDVALDQKIAGMVKDAGRGLIIVVTKWDRIKEDSQDFDYDKFIKNISRDYEFVTWAPLIVTSSISGQNVSKIFELILKIYTSRQTVIPTPKLNDWLGKVVREHPPAGLKNRMPKLNYIVQETDNPILSFKIFGSHSKYVHWSYRRYLERKMREEFDIFGNPIQFWFIEKHTTHKNSNYTNNLVANKD